MKSQKGFPGFPEGRLRLTPIPNPFFSELLPTIDHLGEMKVTLYAFWALAQKEGRFRYIRREEMLVDDLLMEGLVSPGMTSGEALDEALERAVARGTLLKVTISFENDTETFFFLNTPKGRAALSGIEQGEWRPSGIPDAPLELNIERPNIYSLYEQNIGPLTPMIAERLHDSELSYPAHWIEEAIRIAVENNVRKWRYIEAILEDWRTRGKDERKDRGDSEKARRRYVEGEFADFWDS
jgi:DnaD/phage-associated family protein